MPADEQAAVAGPEPGAPGCRKSGRNGRLRLKKSSAKIKLSVFARVLYYLVKVSHTLAPGRQAYGHVVRGEVNVNGQALATGDAAKLTDETSIEFTQAKNAEILLFDLP